MKKLTAIVLEAGIVLTAPVIGHVIDSNSGVYAQTSQKDKDFSNGTQRYLWGMNSLPEGDSIQDDTPDLGVLSYSGTNFKMARDHFFSVVMADPNHAEGRAVEMYVMSKLALNEDITGTVKDYLKRSDFKHKTKLKNFLVDILNDERGEINFLWDEHPKIQQAMEWGKNVEDFDHSRTIELLQTLYEVDKNAFYRVDTDEDDIIGVSQRISREGNHHKSIDILNENWDRFPLSANLPWIKGNIFFDMGNINQAKKNWKIAKERTSDFKYKKYFQNLIDNN